MPRPLSCAGQSSTTDDDEQDKHECEQPTGDDNQSAHVGADVSELLLPSQLNRVGRGHCYAPAGANGRPDDGGFRQWAFVLNSH